MIMQNSGPAGFSIIFLSFVALYMSLRFFYQIRPKELMPEALVMKVQDDLDNGRLREAVEACSLTNCAFSRMVKGALVKIDGGYDSMNSGMEEAGGVEAIRLQQTVNWLAVIGAVAPMLGLLGTVQGMMGAFGVIGASDTTPPPKMLASWIQLALVTTVEGLVVAIPVLMCYSYFRVRITNNMLLLGAAGLDIVDRFKGVEITPAMVAEVRDAAHLRVGGTVAAPAQEEAPPPVEEGAPPPPPPE
jgi:biopolymer transport protein ExbB